VFVHWCKTTFLIPGLIALAVAQDRMPPIQKEKMTELQRKVWEKQMEGRDPSRALGPSVVQLRSPELWSRLTEVGQYLRFQGPLDPKLRELITLLAAREYTQQFEWNAHKPAALKVLKPEIINAIADARRPIGMTEDEEIVYDFISELQRNKSVSDFTYERAVKRFGEQQIVDMIGLEGFYSTLGMMMNVARTPSPSSELKPFPK
jgi:4-carboxymuconolactone decarboxylase